ncbi:MAG: hypothetical protein HY513_00800 [Candidatus Aenigmarchaeota archaeon]|nr:hypothetical protein [Candidatus Aenigmarchaeota archaeon]
MFHMFHRYVRSDGSSITNTELMRVANSAAMELRAALNLDLADDGNELGVRYNGEVDKLNDAMRKQGYRPVEQASKL